MKKYQLTMSKDAINIAAEEIICSDGKPSFWECEEIAEKNGCTFWTIEEITEEESYLKYDSKEDINKCLHCEREKCVNCLRFKNNV